ncbi:MAG: tRNA (N6-isopentenyl adenosine(37)-C2)-methylthiotransferase MiaB, partial [Candidatus Omnitrophica bacterium]|nr:tRNA (N6-isopentenyl adenosine(37)-C2)-methylthiotransferase MiaB [Candidatus Omnitrophota bacterium]
MATNLRKELLENRNINIDFIAGPDSYKRLPDLIREASQTGEKTFDVTLSEFETYSDIQPLRKEGTNAWIAVMRGCNNFCTFCVVPYTRGRERSRGVENVVEEVRRLADEGFKQVTLLGQNVNSYSHDGKDFADLLESISRIDGIKRIRFTSPHPKDFPDKLIELVATNPKVCKQMHLPLQAGNNRILDLMNRTYTQEEFLSLVDKMRARIPNVSMTTDIIAGFPTETDEEFEDTFRVMQKVEFDAAYIFKYSERKNTLASKKYPDDIPEDIKGQRVLRLSNLQKDMALKRNLQHVGQTHAVLVEYSDRNTKEWKGRTDGGQLVTLPGNHFQIGQWVNVTITAATPHTLKGNIV